MSSAASSAATGSVSFLSVFSSVQDDGAPKRDVPSWPKLRALVKLRLEAVLVAVVVVMCGDEEGGVVAGRDVLHIMGEVVTDVPNENVVANSEAVVALVEDCNKEVSVSVPLD